MLKVYLKPVPALIALRPIKSWYNDGWYTIDAAVDDLCVYVFYGFDN